MSERRHAATTEPGPNEMRDPVTRAELRKAMIWFSVAIGIALIVLLIQPLLIIFGALVFASMLDGGVRLLGKVLPIPRGLRLLIVMLLATAFVLGTFYLAGMQIAAQANQLRDTLEVQAHRVMGWMTSLDLMPGKQDIASLAKQALGSVGKVTTAVGTAVGAVTTMFMILVIGLFIAMEPRIYDRGLQWMVPLSKREDFAVTLERMAQTMRSLLAGRLLGMAFEGVLTWIFLAIAGVPMALLLGIITGLLAFIPNIGAFISGLLMVSVGFSAGVDTGLWALAIYFGVQTFDGYVVIPMVARRTVDLPPALTLSAQILASTLFGILGLALADPMVAMIKVALERESELAARAGYRLDDEGENQPDDAD
ncbi:MAG: AI-2E family transporter [Sphingomonas sp.]|nr:AI-2E family transporter [Sphingomonas sp.]